VNGQADFSLMVIPKMNILKKLLFLLKYVKNFIINPAIKGMNYTA